MTEPTDSTRKTNSSKRQADEWLVIGVVTAPFGVRGEMKVRLETDFPERYKEGRAVHVRLPGEKTPIERTLKTVRFHKGVALVRFEDSEKVEDAERYRGSELLVPASDRMKLSKDQYYIVDLIGVDVYLEDGRHLGKVEQVLPGNANDVYVVGKILIPAVKNIVQSVDLEQKRMIVRSMPGLLPEDEESE